MVGVHRGRERLPVGDDEVAVDGREAVGGGDDAREDGCSFDLERKRPPGAGRGRDRR
jgi:hypothetical protein